MKLIVDQYSILDSDLYASAALLAQGYSALATTVNGIVGNEGGPLPGFLVQTTTVEKEVDLADGAALTGVLLGMIVSDSYIDAQTPAGSGPGKVWKTSSGDKVLSVGYIPGLRVTVEAYAIRNELNAADLSYAVGDLLYRSTYGVVTKDNTTTTVIGVVAAVNADGTLDIILN